MQKKNAIRLAIVAVVIAACVFGAMSTFAKGKPTPNGCPFSDLLCPDVWDPVTCDNGVTYSNACYAMRVCATGCESSGGPVEL